MLVSRRGCSSISNRPCGVSIGTISSLKRPSSMAWIALRCEPSAHSSISSRRHTGLDRGVPADGDRHVHVGRIGPVGVGGRKPVDHLVAHPALEPRRRRRRVHAAGDHQLVHARADAGRCALHGGLARGAVPVLCQPRHRRQPGRDRGVTCDDATAVEPLAQDDVVDRARIEVGGGVAHHVFGELVGIGIAQRALHRGADRSAQGGHDDGFWHEVTPFQTS